MTYTPVEVLDWVPTRDRTSGATRRWNAAERVVVFHDNNFTVAVAEDSSGRLAAGVAKRNPKDDPYVEERGERLAVIRAYRSLRSEGWR